MNTIYYLPAAFFALYVGLIGAGVIEPKSSYSPINCDQHPDIFVCREDW